MGFFLIAVFLWGLIIGSILLFMRGLWKKSWKAFVWSGIAFIVPAIIFATQKGLFSLFLIIPLIAFGAAYFTNKGQKN